MIDPHVHCRDWNQRHKETVAHALSVAQRAGLSGIFDMPNTDPPLISRERIRTRLEEADRAGCSVFYAVYAGVTADPVQLREIVAVYREYFPRVVGLKLYAGHSVGSLAVPGEEEQRRVYSLLAELGYTGVLAVHCEKETAMHPELWDPGNPLTHGLARPALAEIESIGDQIQFAADAGFSGVLHIAHISCPESVELIQREREYRSFRISCGVTPHHCMLSDKFARGTKGLLYKVNPPLRSSADAATMVNYLRAGAIDVVETDHAPHTLKEKLHPPYYSGFPGLPIYPYFIHWLLQRGFSRNEIDRCTHHRVCELFGIDLPNTKQQPAFDLHREYEVDCYEQVRKGLGLP